ncbi:GrpB family protein [Paenibacillus sp. EC2-1]|uniref:GrpB family protein n=1 Tax=Paenibacillus sp. EC2-1 TaxID=3388665 RepID=UPI003BEF1B33
MPDPIIIVPYDTKWQIEFKEIGKEIRQALGQTAIRIDHIGSTSIEGLDAKPIVDIQVSVARLEAIELYKSHFERIGFRHRVDNIDLTKRYFREKPGKRRVHIHVRESGSWSEQFALLFRDYLRVHPADCKKYAEEKYRLMELFKDARERYVEGKEPVIWDIMTNASRWSQEMGWKPGLTDV